MKENLGLSFIFLVSLVNSACSSDPPSVRVGNERSGKANVDFHPSSGSTLHIQDVLGGTTSCYIDVPEGSYRVSASLSGGDGAT
jgi:hypothetical protein